MNKTIKVADLKAGMEIIENDGYLLTVISVAPVGKKIKVVCESMHRQTENIVSPKYNVNVMA
jgi:hypothetical protein